MKYRLIIVLMVIIGISFLVYTEVNHDDSNSPNQITDTQNSATTPTPVGTIVISPGVPASVNAKVVYKSITLSWYRNAENVDHYNIYRKISNSNKWTLIASVKVENNNRNYEWGDTSLEGNTYYKYGVSAVDTNNVESQITSSNEVLLPYKY